MTNQQGALQYADRDHTDLGSYYMRHVSAMTGEALHSKSAIAAELAHRDREIDRLQDENANLNAGYAAARLEIESLQARIKTMAEEHADELMVAHLDGRMRAAQQPDTAYAELPSYEHQRAIMEGERNASLDSYSRVVYLTSAESRLYEAAFSNGWDRHAAQVAALTAAPQGGAYAELPKDVIRAVFIENGFTVKEGQTDLKQYVYDAANELLRRARLRASHGQAPAQAAPQPSPTPQADSGVARVGMGVAHTLSDAQIDAMPVWRNFVGLWPESRREIVDAVADLLAARHAQAADSVLDDAARLDWLLLRISGAEFRRIGVHYSGNARRADVDAARKQGANHD